MSPTVLLADPSVRIAGLRAPTPHRVVRPARAIRLRWVLSATLLALAVAALGYLRTVPPLATVMSGSMAPTIDTGDVVVLQRLSRPARVGDVVMIHVPEAARSRYGYPAVVIHRVAAIGPDGMVTSKGDARKETDPFTVPQTALTTRVVTHIPAAGQLLGFFTSTLGLLWLGSGVALLVGVPLLERHRRGQGSREDRDRALDDALQAAATAQALLAQHLAELPRRSSVR
jgi:signal peptidase I